MSVLRETVGEPTIDEILAEFRSMLARSKTQADCDESLEWAWGFLPVEVSAAANVAANTAVIQEVSRRRKELRNK